MISSDIYTLINPQTGNLAFKVFSFNDNSHFDHVQRLNYYSLIWIKNGKGVAKADFSEYHFTQNTLFAFSPYQPFMFQENEQIQGIVINFHPDFFCIHKHHQEVACNGVLFNNIYNPPLVAVDENTSNTFKMLFEQITAEMQNPALAQYELLVSYLKIFLITASRLKAEQQTEILINTAENKEPFILQNLKNYIETHFKTKHSASDYADLLNISAKTLAKITKTHFNKTLTDLISERIIIEAKRELYLTNKAVKEIAYELGYADEYYFSRFFKTNADISPQAYRDTVGFGRAMV
ncbi:helix-turn-helix domain-containing protein [Dyadobacter frigoris]|uniref:Helix-turn-helix domain-containing protein n=1 Tax=Dyadobacter frigoris TaxID=2576211 RepID=A0A4U6D3C9_9BACT|nr:helix-turn-helix domain-containing protein [Dyadobacter frigoris]TKT90388.1 helix-turn-helix domain-containing protein [Dyadobacter frigoris]GLU57278.1 AraC family transcriptional regulator [Dyadobacter frigoris]